MRRLGSREESRTSRLIIAERFEVERAGLSAMVLPLDVIARQPVRFLEVSVLGADLSDFRAVAFPWEHIADAGEILLCFRRFADPGLRCFYLIVAGRDAGSELQPSPDLSFIRAQARQVAGRPPCRFVCFHDDEELGEHVGLPVPVKTGRQIMACHYTREGTQHKIRIEYALERFWCDRYGMYFEGWIHAYENRIRELIVAIGPDQRAVSEFGARPDVGAHYAEYPHAAESGFAVYVPSQPGEPVSFTVMTDAEMRTIPIKCPKLELEEASRSPLDLEAFRQFAAEVNARKGVVLEIGARLVSPEAEDFRPYFPGASRYIGVDVHPSETVDVVGDVHFLSSLVGEHSVDAVFSMAVLEHLSYPWLVAAEINRVLRPDGLVFHVVPHSFPVHETPNDFWRFSDEGLKVLFGPSTGFEVLDAGMRGPIEMYSHVRSGPLLLFPLNPGYCNAYILARKVRDLERAACAWPIDATTSSSVAGRYPRHSSSGPEPRAC